MQSVASIYSSLTSSSCDLHGNATCIIRRCSFINFEANWETQVRLSSRTRSRRVSHAVLLLSVLWRNRQTIARLVLRLKRRNRCDDFVSQITKPQLPILRPNPGNLKLPVLRINREKPSTLVLRPNQETHAHRLLVHGADLIRCHPTSQSSGHRVPDLCFTIPGPLSQVSYSFHDPHHCLSCRTCHLHITRKANTILHTNR
jgi:hypothetical protein